MITCESAYLQLGIVMVMLNVEFPEIIENNGDLEKKNT